MDADRSKKTSTGFESWMLLIAIPMLSVVTMKKSWRNNFYWRTMPNSFAALESLADFSLFPLAAALS
jgi:hypothetical protein